MNKLLKSFEKKKPEVVFEWKDKLTEAEGWIVINSLRGGASWWNKDENWRNKR